MVKGKFGKWLLTFMAGAALAVGTGCGDKDGGGGSVVSGDPPDAIPDVNAVVFVEVALGETDVQTLTVQNVGKGDLRISAAKLFEDDDVKEFSEGDEWTNEATLKTDEFIRYTINYTPEDENPDTGVIELVTNDPKYTDGLLQIPLETPQLAPRIFSQETVVFPRVPPVNQETRDKVSEIIEVQNIGEAPLVIDDIVVSPPDSDYRITFPDSLDDDNVEDDGSDFPTTLESDESFPLRIIFNPVDDEPSTADLIFYSNDPEASEYVVSLLGNSGSPCLQLSHEDEINFGEGGIGYANNKTIIMENCSPVSDLEVTSITVCTDQEDGTCDEEDPIYQLKDGSLPTGLPEPNTPLVIGPEDTGSFVITYTPEDLSQSTGELNVRSNDPAKPNLVVPIVGKGTDNACPQAVAEASIADANRWDNEILTIPLKTIQFRSSDSVDVDGNIASYEWDIVQRPNGSTTQFAPSNMVADPELFLDLAGEYIVELRVFDNEGSQSCGDQALIRIVATPDEDIHVQLVWSTPTDTNQTDANGTDLDLHFLHPNGRWNATPYDIYWLNPTSEWGVPGPDDDPSLDIDDVDGAGPENVNMKDPEDGLNYSVGVYYYASGGFGPSYATIRIYIGGVETYEYRDMFMPNDTAFWRVATISWPTGVVSPINTVENGFPGQ